MLATPHRTTAWADDRAALRAACDPGVGLCTIVGIEGSFSRRLGAQLAVHPDGAITGSLADGCLEKQLASEIAAAPEPAPDYGECRGVVAMLEDRKQARLRLPGVSHMAVREYIPALRLQLFGEGPELEALVALAGAAGVEAMAHGKDALSLGRRPAGLSADPWTAVVLLFHDHEWEQPILEWALETPAFHIGAQGGFEARRSRIERLAERGVPPEQLARIRSPIGVIAHSREPGVLALSVLAEIVGEYEALHPHG